MDSINQALAVLNEGGLVAIPTETVYGLAADAENPAAVAAIYAAKKRPANHPLIVHVATAAAISHWARDIPPEAIRLTEQFWPGPLTIVLKRSAAAKDFITGGQDTVALRCPSHPWTHALLKAFDGGCGRGLAAPSANSFGRISPTTAEHVRADLGEKPTGSVDLIVDGGPCDVGIESTILDLTSEKPRILREGAITGEMIAHALGLEVEHGASITSPVVSGSLKSHYAPSHPLVLSSAEDLAGHTQRSARNNKTFGLIAPEALARRFAPVSTLTFGYTSVQDLSRHLYEWLHRLDASGADVLFAVPPALDGTSAGVIDRLTRAAADKKSL